MAAAWMKLGGELEWERGKKTVAQILRTQDESGLLHYFCDTSGVYIKSSAIVRKTADTMHFLLKFFSLMQPLCLPVLSMDRG